MRGKDKKKSQVCCETECASSFWFVWLVPLCPSLSDDCDSVSKLAGVLKASGTVARKGRKRGRVGERGIQYARQGCGQKKKKKVACVFIPLLFSFLLLLARVRFFFLHDTHDLV